MESITFGQVASNILFIASIIGGVGAIVGVISRTWKWLNKKELSPVLQEIKSMEERIVDKMEESDNALNERIDNLSSDLTALEIGQCKNFLVKYMAEIERGENPDVAETERAFETMDRYTKDLHQNSYIHKRWEEVVENTRNNKR